MNRLCIAIIVALSVAVSGCGKKKDHASFFAPPTTTGQNIILDSIAVDSIDVVVPNSSYAGFDNMHGDRIFFADKYFCWVYEFDKDGRQVARHVGQGRAPHEISLKEVMGYGVSPRGEHYFVGSARDVYVFDPAFTTQRRLSFLPDPAGARDKEVFERSDFYSPDYDNMIVREHKGTLLFNVTGGDEQSNISHRNYYTNSRIIMAVDADKGNVTDIMGRISPAVKYMSAFWRHQYDIDDDGNFFVSFEADPVIYVYNNRFDLRHAFGHIGRGMNSDYDELSAGREYGALSAKEREEKGYYTSIRTIGDYVFRTYKTGGNMKNDRMQIYRDMTLVGDVAVPRDAAVMGYIAPYYYFHILADENKETLTLYRFRLGDEK